MQRLMSLALLAMAASPTQGASFSCWFAHPAVARPAVQRGGALALSAEPEPEPEAEPEGDLRSDPGAWRIVQARLVERERARLRRRKPAFFSFHHARQWARAMHFTTEQDWRQWIADGEKRNPYVPSNPDEIYAADFKGWDDFLNGDIHEEFGP